MAKIKKQDRLSKKYHTCTCGEHEFIIDWSSTELIDINFDTPDQYIPEGRTMWFVSTCKMCHKKVLHGRQFCDTRITGERLFSEALRTARIHLPLRKQSALPRAIRTIWEKYNTSLYHHEIQSCMSYCREQLP